jgi:hypothetical protein
MFTSGIDSHGVLTPPKNMAAQKSRPRLPLSQ